MSSTGVGLGVSNPAWNLGSGGNYSPVSSSAGYSPVAPSSSASPVVSPLFNYDFRLPVGAGEDYGYSTMSPSGQATTYLPPPSVSALVQPTPLAAPAAATQPLLQDVVGPKLGVTVGPDEVAAREAALTPAVGPDGAVPSGGTTAPAATPNLEVASQLRAELARIQKAVPALPGADRTAAQNLAWQAKSQIDRFEQLAGTIDDSSPFQSVLLSNAEEGARDTLAMLMAKVSDAKVDLDNTLELERSLFASRGVDATTLRDRLANTGTLWATENAGKLSEAQRAEASTLLNEMAAYEPDMQQALDEGDLDRYNKLNTKYKTASQAFLELKTSIGGEPGKRRWNGYYTKSGEWVSDTSGVLVWAQILVPLVATGLTLGMTMHENEKTRKWTEEQNEEEREHQMALTQLRGEQALALQRVANEGSGTASVGASSGVSSLGGSFHTA